MRTCKVEWLISCLLKWLINSSFLATQEDRSSYRTRKYVSLCCRRLTFKVLVQYLMVLTECSKNPSARVEDPNVQARIQNLELRIPRLSWEFQRPSWESTGWVGNSQLRVEKSKVELRIPAFELRIHMLSWESAASSWESKGWVGNRLGEQWILWVGSGFYNWELLEWCGGYDKKRHMCTNVCASSVAMGESRGRFLLTQVLCVNNMFAVQCIKRIRESTQYIYIYTYIYIYIGAPLSLTRSENCFLWLLLVLEACIIWFYSSLFSR